MIRIEIKQMSRKTRVRFAPSPTGPLHIGGVRTALYNYLFARQREGDFILRIEDTDQSRLVPEAEQYIVDALNWCGLVPDEGPGIGGAFGPYRQSERRDLYRQHIQILLEKGAAYYAFDTVEELEEMRARESSQENKVPKYDHRTRLKMLNSLTLSPDETKRRISEGTPYTIRLLVPDSGEVHFEDEVRGKVVFQCKELDDKVLLKADGLPTYHFANVVDDKHMQITDVIRGEEWLSSTAHHVLLYQAFGWLDEMPVFTHLPLILKPEGSGKLSKRDGQKFGFPVFPLAWKGHGNEDSFEGFDSRGFHPAAVLNFLAFLGWNPGTEQEIFSLSELIKSFKVNQVGKSGARFDFDKAIWFNTQYILSQSPMEIAERSKPFLLAQDIEADPIYLRKVAALMRERIHTYCDLAQDGRYFFHDVEKFNLKVLRKKWKDETQVDYEELVRILANSNSFNAASLKEAVTVFIQKSGRSFGDILPLLRLALAGDTKGPDLFDMMETMGQQTVASRLNASEKRFTEALLASGN